MESWVKAYLTSFIDIVGISELKWTGMGEFNSVKNPLEEWGSHHSQQKSPKCSSLGQSQK